MTRFYLIGTFVTFLVGASLAFYWYVAPRLREVSRDIALQPLILVHFMRCVGPISLVPGVALPSLAPEFAVPQAVGDFTTAIIAIIAVALLRLKWSIAIPVVWLFTLVGR